MTLQALKFLPENLQNEFLYSSAAELIDLVRSTETLNLREDVPAIVDRILSRYDNKESVLAYYNVFVRPALGTERAVQYILDILDIPANLQEWFEPNDMDMPPYKFALEFDEYPRRLPIDNLIDLIYLVKNERSHLTTIRQPKFCQNILVLDSGNLSEQLLSDVSGYNYRGVTICLVENHPTHMNSAVRYPVITRSNKNAIFTRQYQEILADWPLDYFILGEETFHKPVVSSQSAVQFTHVAVTASNAASVHDMFYCDTQLSETLNISEMGQTNPEGTLVDNFFTLGDLELSENSYEPQVTCKIRRSHMGHVTDLFKGRSYSLHTSYNISQPLFDKEISPELDNYTLSDGYSFLQVGGFQTTLFGQVIDQYLTPETRIVTIEQLPENLGNWTLSATRLSASNSVPTYIEIVQNLQQGLKRKVIVRSWRSEIGSCSIELSASLLDEDNVLNCQYPELLRQSNYIQALSLSELADLSDIQSIDIYQCSVTEQHWQQVSVDKVHVNSFMKAVFTRFAVFDQYAQIDYNAVDYVENDVTIHSNHRSI